MTMKIVNIILRIILFLLLIVMSPVIGLAIMIDVINDKPIKYEKDLSKIR